LEVHLRRNLLLVASLCLSLGAPLRADGLYGSILAGREALNVNDFLAAEMFFDRAHALDPDNLRFADGLLTAEAALGHFEAALPLARELADAGEMSPAIGVTLLVDAANREDWAALKDIIAKNQSPVPQVDLVFTAWAEVGLGNMDAALAALDELGTRQGSEVMSAYHKSLALALAGDLNSAFDALRTPAGQNALSTRRGILANIEILSGLERNDEAATMTEELFSFGNGPPIDALLTRLRAGEPLPFTVVRSAKDGIAETFFTLTAAMDERTPRPYVLAMARAAVALRPEHSDATLVIGSLYDDAQRYREANVIFDSVPKGDLNYHLAQLGRVDDYSRLGEDDKAIAVLEALATDYPELLQIPADIGDIHRNNDEFAACVPAYDRAIELAEARGQTIWEIHFYRAICNERLGEWEKAEADFRKALEVEPNRAEVLNYLGYSYVERRENLEEALELINRAARSSPDSGYIVDSLGWAYYRLGRYAEAVIPMERAVRLTPTDAVINDHLGDVYWAVGRTREARFQWERALSFEPDEPDLTRIRRKLDVGLDVVLQEEGAAPIAPAGDL
jgi:tetratricopeptide (TPR) repeat protein